MRQCRAPSARALTCDIGSKGAPVANAAFDVVALAPRAFTIMKEARHRVPAKLWGYWAVISQGQELLG
jgi:hypothetical protein